MCLLKGKGMVTAEEVAGFRNGEYWGEDTDLFLDDDLVFFKTLGNGKLRKKNIVGSFLNPFSTMYKRYGKISDDIKNNANLVGEGSSWEGLFVISKNAVVYAHKEKHYGTVAPIDGGPGGGRRRRPGHEEVSRPRDFCAGRVGSRETVRNRGPKGFAF